MDDGEIVLSEEEEAFLHGRCHLFAIALSRIAGLPLQAYLDIDDDVERPVLCHAFVRDGDHILDVRGRIPLANALDEFDSNDPWLVDISEGDLMQIGSGRRAVEPSDEHFTQAMALAEALVEKDRELAPPTVSSPKS